MIPRKEAFHLPTQPQPQPPTRVGQESDESEIKLIIPCDKALRRLEDLDWSVLGAVPADHGSHGGLRKRRAMARGDGEMGGVSPD